MYANFVGIIYSPEKKAKDIEVTGTLPIKVTKIDTPAITRYNVEYYEYKAPVLNLTVTPSVAEVGSTVSAQFNGTYTGGSEPVSHITVDPNVTPNITETTISFTATVGSNIEGTFGNHTVTVHDESGKETSKTAGVKFQHRYRWGFIPRGADVTAFIVSESKLADSIKGAYGMDTLYTFPSGDHHLAWLMPMDENVTLVTGDANMEWTTIDAGQLTYTNGDVTVAYRVIKTLGDYSGTSEPVTLRIVQ
jgi:hypothetical protein